MKTIKNEFKILSLDLEVIDLGEPAYIRHCGGILYNLHTREEIDRIDAEGLSEIPFADRDGNIVTIDHGLTQKELYHKLRPLISKASRLVCHNRNHDPKYIKALFVSYGSTEDNTHYDSLPWFCTMLDLAEAIGHIDQQGNTDKWPELKEALDHYLPDNTYEHRNNAFEDAEAALKLFLAALDAGDIPSEFAA